jgi:hypothetical protein
MPENVPSKINGHFISLTQNYDLQLDKVMDCPIGTVVVGGWSLCLCLSTNPLPDEVSKVSQ